MNHSLVCPGLCCTTGTLLHAADYHLLWTMWGLVVVLLAAVVGFVVLASRAHHTVVT